MNGRCSIPEAGLPAIHKKLHSGTFHTPLSVKKLGVKRQRLLDFAILLPKRNSSNLSTLGTITVQAAQAPPARRQPNKSNKPNLNKVNKSPEADFWDTFVSRLVKAAAIFLGSAAIAFGVFVRPAEAARSGGRMGGMSSFSGRSSHSMYGGSSSLSGHRSVSGMPSYRSTVSSSAFFFSPFGFGYGYGYPIGGIGGFTSLLFWGVFAMIAIQAVRGVLQGGDGYSRELDTGERLSVAKVQVGLLGSARELQKDLERIASRADTSSPRGLHYVLQEMVLALMRNPNYCVYGFAKSGIENSADEAEARFNKLSLEERGKFEKETRVNVGGRTSTSTLGIKPDLTTPVTELIVVTILVAAAGRVKLPKVTGRKELIDALTTLGAIPENDILAVEVLWTPEEEDDYFTQEDLAADYPLLNTL